MSNLLYNSYVIEWKKIKTYGRKLKDENIKIDLEKIKKYPAVDLLC